MNLAEIKRGQIVILQRHGVDDLAPPNSTGYGERIVAEVISFCNSVNKGKVRVRFRNPFAGEQGHGLVQELPVDPRWLSPPDREHVLAAAGVPA